MSAAGGSLDARRAAPDTSRRGPIAQALGIEDVGLVRDAIATPAGRDIGELRVGDRITYRGQEYVVKHDSAGVALRMTAADPGVYGDHPDYREEWRT